MPPDLIHATRINMLLDCATPGLICHTSLSPKVYPPKINWALLWQVFWRNCAANIFVVMSPKNRYITLQSQGKLDHHRGPNSNDRDHPVRGRTTDTRDVKKMYFCHILSYHWFFFSLIPIIAKNNILSLLSSFALQQIEPHHLASCPLPKTYYSLPVFSVFATKISRQRLFSVGCFVYFHNREIWRRVFI